MKKIALTGRPFVGKSHLARRLVGDQAVISIGDELRRAGATSGLETGGLSKAHDLADHIFDQAIQDPAVVIIDGYPRTVSQLHHLRQIPAEARPTVVSVHASLVDVWSNVVGMRLCSQCFKATDNDWCVFDPDHNSTIEADKDFVSARWKKTFELEHDDVDWSGVDRVQITARDLWDGRADWILARLGVARTIWVRIDGQGTMPTRSYCGDAGYDLYVSEDRILDPDKFTDVPHDISMAMPKGVWGLIHARSSTVRHRRLFVPTSVIDNGYRGRLFTSVFNPNSNPVTVRAGDRISQMIMLPVSAESTNIRIAADLGPSDRGARGFGSSGT
jgi:dUTP pyrophosphatase